MAHDGFAYACRLEPSLIDTIKTILTNETNFGKENDIHTLLELALPRILPNIPEDMVPVGITTIAENTFEYTLRERNDPAVQQMAAFRQITWPPSLCEFFER